MHTTTDLFLHEEIMLLVLRDREGTVEFGANYLHALGGSILAELLMAQRVRVQEEGKKRIAHVVSPEPLGDPVIDECLDAMATSTKPRSLQSWVSRFANLKDLKHRVARQLCGRGILRADEDKVLLIFTRKTYPEIDPGPEQAIIERLREAIFTDAAEVDPRTTVLLSLARGADLLRFAFDKKELKSRTDRMEQIVNGELAGRATKEAIEAMQAAVFVTVIMPTIIATTTVTR